MISAWWWAGLAVAGIGASLLALAGRSLRAELVAVRHATVEVESTRAAIEAAA